MTLFIFSLPITKVVKRDTAEVAGVAWRPYGELSADVAARPEARGFGQRLSTEAMTAA